VAILPFSVAPFVVGRGERVLDADRVSSSDVVRPGDLDRCLLPGFARCGDRSRRLSVFLLCVLCDVACVCVRLWVCLSSGVGVLRRLFVSNPYFVFVVRPSRRGDRDRDRGRDRDRDRLRVASRSRDLRRPCSRLRSRDRSRGSRRLSCWCLLFSYRLPLSPDLRSFAFLSLLAFLNDSVSMLALEVSACFFVSVFF